MKIGILTFHNANNYGALLQAYGLQQVLKKMGHSVEFVNYRNNTIEASISYFSLKHNSLFRVLKRCICSYSLLRTLKKNFENFRENYLAISSKRIYPNTLKSMDYDMLVIGSDQIWNPLLTGGLDPVYWGNESGNIPTITYAASSNDLYNLSDNDINRVCKYVQNFKCISVRENRLQVFLKDKCGIDSSVVLDPTLLAGKDVFNKIAAERIYDKPYVLVYGVENKNDVLKNIAYSIAKEKQLEVLVIDIPTQAKLKFWKEAKIINPTLPQFLSAFKYAEFVICLSFHGTAFSILFEREFYTIKGGNMARVYTLLKQLELIDRIKNDENDVNENNVINYDKVNSLLENLRKISYQYIEI